jgi:hypothetical protein
VAERLIKAHRKGSDYSIGQRVAAFVTEIRQMRSDGRELTFQNVVRGFPEAYRPATPEEVGERGTLVEVKRTGTVSVPLGQVTGLAYQGPREVPENAWLLVEDERPRRALPTLVLATIALLALLGGLTLLALGLRRPTPPGAEPRAAP